MSVFYTGKNITNQIPKDVIDQRNNSKSWQYGYNEEYEDYINDPEDEINYPPEIFDFLAD